MIRLKNMWGDNKKKKDFYYYTYFLKYQSLKYYLGIYNCEDYVSVPTNFINNSNISSLSVNQIISNIGKPTFKEHSEVDQNHMILFYSYRYSKFSILKSFHFLKGELFFIDVTFQKIGTKQKEKILNTIKNIYNIDKKNIKKQKIVDSQNNILFIEDVFELSVNYLFPNIGKLNNRFKLMKERAIKIERQENEFLENLFYKII